MLALLPTRCVVCAAPLHTLESRELALGSECAALLFNTADAAPDWQAARKHLRGVIALRTLHEHWRRSVRRVVRQLLVLAAVAPTHAPRAAQAIASLGFVKLGQAIGTRHPLPPTKRAAALRYLGVDKTATEAEIRAAFRRKLIEDRLHPDLGGSAASLQNALDARRAAEKRA